MKRNSILFPLTTFSIVASSLTSVYACHHTSDELLSEKEQNEGKEIPSRPNVIFIYADDIGYGDLSCNQSVKTISTPNVDKLANEGIRFTNAYSAAATSTPARYAMLTGEYAWRRPGTGIAAGNAGMIISPERYTIADMFKDAGYSTAVVGKWHLGLGTETGKQNWNGLVTPNPYDLGFDYSYIMAATADRTPCVFMRNGRVVNLDPSDPIEVSYNKPIPGEPTGKANPELLTLHPSHGHNQAIVNGISRIGYMKGGHSARWKDENIADSIVTHAIRFIESQKNGNPFFLYLGTNDIHVPRVPHARFRGKSGMGARGDALLSFDWSVGEVMKTLKHLKLDKNTIIILSSDNGPVIDDGYKDQAVELLGNHRPWGNLRGGKYSSYEAGSRVPCILRWKGTVKPAVSHAMVSQIDWINSFAHLLGITLPAEAGPDSENQLNAWLGKDKTGRKYVIEQNVNNNLSIRTHDWKYIAPGKGAAKYTPANIELGNSQEPQLYRLSDDEGEQNNCASEYPQIVRDMQLRLEQVKVKKY
ncbi:sulfatase-like hydrolase/transferase [uncultured Bacteroides sp.]|uniref:sulfatase-like hydrolase/transferase n=1 Tax=uncultured Bacteroides sp. TaxID=162156 RepID=UPI0026757DC1|nr:sulfatase-like hydrolase/transferase [uncultured Bacteroides sp.]